MIALSIFQSVEFYVILTVVAAAVVALCARPSGRGPVQTHLASGWLTEGAVDKPSSLRIECLDNGDVVVTRQGLTGIYSTGAASLAITRTGNDLRIVERMTPGTPLSVDGEAPVQVREASFHLNFLGRDWYHIKYEAEGSRFAAFSLHVRPGISITRELVQ